MYPLQLYLVVGTVQDLTPGVYGYHPDRHHLVLIQRSDRRNLLASAAFGQDWLANAAAIVVFAADYNRTTRKYGESGKRYVHMKAGHAGQNLFLQAGALDLITVIVGDFDDEEIANVLGLPVQEQSLILMPIGRKQ
ncbi:SagB-type dehydrogenase domain-containing protein [Nitrosomonas sp. Nm33]|nr:SagB-type dehydrogenase domain-containing protein [Nitrosomonas sp. Nm33]